MKETDRIEETTPTRFAMREARHMVRGGKSIETELAWTEHRSTAESTELQEALLKTANADKGQVEPAPVGRLYPHLLDDQGPAGPVIPLINRALEDARQALDAYGDADLASVYSRLATIAALMAKAHELTEFNEDYGSVVSYIRRATITPSPELSRSALNVMVSVLKALSENPAIDIDDAAELVEALANEGWKGELEIGVALLAALFGEEEARILDDMRAMPLPNAKLAFSQEG